MKTAYTKTITLISFITALPLTANANVVLQSNNDNLLINGKPAQLRAQVYDANDSLQSNIKIIDNDGSEITALVTIDDLTGLFEIRAYGYHQAEGGYGSSAIYSPTCEKIGQEKGSFYDVDYVAQGSRIVGEESSYQVYTIGDRVSGYTVNGLNLDYDSNGDVESGQDCSQGVPVTGYALEYSASLTSSVNAYFNQLAFPLSIK